MNQELLFFHLKSNYVITVKKTKLGCDIVYPDNYFIQPNLESHTDTYSFIDGRIEFTSSIGSNKELEVHGYDNRLVVLTDLSIKAARLGISTKLILYFDGLKRKNNIFHILPPPESKELAEKEFVMIDRYPDIRNLLLYPKDAEDLNIVDGYNNITNLIVSGGL